MAGKTVIKICPYCDNSGSWGFHVRLQQFATLAALCALLCGCGTITQGPTQAITFISNPPGAECELWQNGKWRIATLTTPATITVRKTKYDIEMACQKDGYKDGTTTLISGYGLGVFGNAIIGGYVGWGIDSATGSDNKYPSIGTVSLTPLAPARSASLAAVIPPEN
jgi:hypothetical protein